ncbi:MAG: DUF3368 domain-containing protein [Chloroflexi bacterium]|nr:DUF3368 domain-containing protein [Chloroflexota bacterium]
MIVISDTSPVVSLAIIGQLELLPQLYRRVVIPRAVRDEIVVAGVGQPGAYEMDTLEWVDIRSVANASLLRVLRLMLDPGEAEVVALGMESGADLLLLDDRKARNIALRLELPFAGTLDVLVAAKRAGLVSTLQPLLDDLIMRARFRVGRRLYERVLAAAEEGK